MRTSGHWLLNIPTPTPSPLSSTKSHHRKKSRFLWIAFWRFFAFPKVIPGFADDGRRRRWWSGMGSTLGYKARTRHLTRLKVSSEPLASRTYEIKQDIVVLSCTFKLAGWCWLLCWCWSCISGYTVLMGTISLKFYVHLQFPLVLGNGTNGTSSTASSTREKSTSCL